MANVYSFSKIVKEEIVNSDFSNIDKLKALLSSYIRINGSLLFQNRVTKLLLKSENAKISRFIYESLSSFYPDCLTLNFVKKHNFNKVIYEILMESKVEELLTFLDISFLEGKISKNVVYNEEMISGYIAGAFLASGSINSPLTSNYHLEISLNSENYAKWICHLFLKIKNRSIEPKITKRRDRYIIYFKKSDQIANFLVFIGAIDSCLEFENIRVTRDITNNANRLQNGDAANMKKTYETALRQIKEIKWIDKVYGIENLENEKERKLCYLRLENETASMNDLAKMMTKEFSKNDDEITKGTINHLFRTLHKKYLLGHPDEN